MKLVRKFMFPDAEGAQGGEPKAKEEKKRTKKLKK